MGQSIKAILQLLLFLCVITTSVALMAVRSVSQGTRLIELICPAIGMIIVALLILAKMRKEILPDFLSEINKKYFERNGFCFAFQPEVIDGFSRMNIFFQNRYSNPCIGVVSLEPLNFVSDNPLGIVAEINCEGGAYGVCDIPWPLASSLQGLTVRFGVACQTKYPLGRGKLLRFREGLRISLSTSRHFALTAFLLPLGHIFIYRPARIKFTLPKNVSEIAARGDEPTLEILWSLDSFVKNDLKK
jgi:hypothetical protein